MLTTFDVCIVRSGAASGIGAYVLTQKGLKVPLLEADRSIRRRIIVSMFGRMTRTELLSSTPSASRQ